MWDEDIRFIVHQIKETNYQILIQHGIYPHVGLREQKKGS